ncbi:hypothetical protein [Clostridium sp. JNZ J1-5]|nr:hypothetical protein [Clostridium sp.]
MGNRKVIQTYYTDVNNLADMLGKLVNSYRLLIGGADELNKIALSNKGQVKDALKRANKLGDVIDEIIDILEKSSYNYVDYCELKSEVLKDKINMESIVTEIQEDLSFKD